MPAAVEVLDPDAPAPLFTLALALALTRAGELDPALGAVERNGPRIPVEPPRQDAGSGGPARHPPGGSPPVP